MFFSSSGSIAGARSGSREPSTTKTPNKPHRVAITGHRSEEMEGVSKVVSEGVSWECAKQIVKKEAAIFENTPTRRSACCLYLHGHVIACPTSMAARQLEPEATDFYVEEMIITRYFVSQQTKRVLRLPIAA